MHFMHFIILKSRKQHLSLHSVIPSSQTTSPTCQDYTQFSLCPATYLQLHIICKFSNYNPDEKMKSTNESAECYWSRTDLADCYFPPSESELRGTASGLLLHSSYRRLSSFPDINTMIGTFYFISQNRSITDTQTAPKIIPRYY